MLGKREKSNIICYIFGKFDMKNWHLLAKNPKTANSEIFRQSPSERGYFVLVGSIKYRNRIFFIGPK